MVGFWTNLLSLWYENTVFLFVVIDGLALMAYEMKDSVGEK